MSTILANTKELIDEVITKHHHLRPEKTSASAYARLRLRILSSAQSKLIEFWNLRDWRFRYVDENVTLLVSGGGYDFTLPAAWGNEGRQGGIWTVDDTAKLEWKRAGEIRNLQQSLPDETGIPRWYGIIGLTKGSVWPKVAANTTLHLAYEKATPELKDSTAADNGLDTIPADWRRAVIYEGTVLLEMLSKGDVGALEAQNAIYKNGVFAACCTEETGKPDMNFMPRFAGSSDVFAEW